MVFAEIAAVDKELEQFAEYDAEEKVKSVPPVKDVDTQSGRHSLCGLRGEFLTCLFVCCCFSLFCPQAEEAMQFLTYKFLYA